MEPLGSLDTEAIENEISKSTSNKRGRYTVYTPQQRFLIAEYAEEHGTSRAVRHFKPKYPGINESTVRTFKSKYNKEVKAAEIEYRQPMQVILSQPRGRPKMLGEIDDMVQRYLRVSRHNSYSHIFFLT